MNPTRYVVAFGGATISNAFVAAWFLLLLWLLGLVVPLSDQAHSIGLAVIAVVYVVGWLGSFAKIAS